MINYRDHLSGKDARELCAARIAAISREAFGNYLTAQSFLAMGREPDATRYLTEVENLNIALGAVLAEQSRWEETDDDNGE